MVKMLKRVQHDGRVGCKACRDDSFFLTTKYTKEARRSQREIGYSGCCRFFNHRVRGGDKKTKRRETKRLETREDFDF
jgi:hypothetical protein